MDKVEGTMESNTIQANKWMADVAAQCVSSEKEAEAHKEAEALRQLEVTRLRGQVQAAIMRRNQAMARQAAGERLGIQELLEIVEELKEARKKLKRETAKGENRI